MQEPLKFSEGKVGMKVFIYENRPHTTGRKCFGEITGIAIDYFTFTSGESGQYSNHGVWPPRCFRVIKKLVVII